MRAQQADASAATCPRADIVLLLETLSAITVPGPDDGNALRRRYLTLMLQNLRAPGLGPLAGPATDPG